MVAGHHSDNRGVILNNSLLRLHNPPQIRSESAHHQQHGMLLHLLLQVGPKLLPLTLNRSNTVHNNMFGLFLIPYRPGPHPTIPQAPPHAYYSSYLDYGPTMTPINLANSFSTMTLPMGNSWYMDSGASAHMTNSSGILMPFIKFKN